MIEVERRSLRPLPFAPTEAKFRPFARVDGLVVRTSLIDRLSHSQPTGVVVVTAPPGYGKSVLVSQWAGEDRRPFAWLRVDEADNDPRVLGAYLVLAMHRLQPVDSGVLTALSDSQDAYAREAVLRELAHVASRRGPMVLVVDGVEALTDARAWEVLQVIGANLAEHCQLVLSGRTVPDLEWPLLEQRGRLLDVGVNDLRLDRAEALALLHGMGLDLSDDDVDALLARTGGWAAGTYLTALSIAADIEDGGSGDLVDGSDSLISDYLGQELFSALSSREQAFLLRTSVLAELTGSLCDAVLVTSGSAELLEQLARSDVLIERVETPDNDWYHVHPLFAEALQAALARRDALLIPTLHRRASAWFEEHHDPDQAIRHAIAADELATAARLVWNQVGGCLSRGQIETVEGWLDIFSPRQTATYAKLALTAAWCALQRGRPADHWVELAEHGRYEADREGESSSVVAGTALLRAMLARNGVAQMGADAQLALRLQAPDTPGRCTAEFLVALSSYLSGRLAEAHSGFERVRDLADQHGAHQVRVLALGELSLLASDQDAWEQARELAELALCVAREHDLQDLSFLAPAHCAAALVAAHFEADEGAAPVVQQARSLFAAAADPPTWAGVQCREVLARAELALGNSAGARKLLSEAQDLLAETDDEHLRDRVAATWRRVSGRPLDVTPGSTLTRAELRVLQLLATHLSFAQIGQQLFVSRNTVKTQAVSAYRKLGVGSRSEAVERADELNLIAVRPLAATSRHGETTSYADPRDRAAPFTRSG